MKKTRSVRRHGREPRLRLLTAEEQRGAGRIISASRRDAGLTQSALAGKLDWSLSRLATIERGVRDISLPELVRVARALGLPPKRLFDRIVGWSR